MVLYQVSQVLSLGREGCENGMVPVETLGVDMVSRLDGCCGEAVYELGESW